MCVTKKFIDMDEMVAILTSSKALASALSAAAADAFSVTVLFPLDIVKLKLQSGMDKKKVLDEVLRDGVSYQGLWSKLIQSTQQKLQFFYFFTILTMFYKRWTNQERLSVFMDLFLGYIASLEGLLTTLPLEVCTMRIITESKKGETSMSLFSMFWTIAREEGFIAFYRTIAASAILSFNPAITYAIFERVKAGFLANRPGQEVLSVSEAFVLGAFSKIAALFVTFPFIRAKVMMNTWKKRQQEKKKLEQVPKEQAPASDAPLKPPTMIETIHQVIREEGVLGLYAGFTPQLIKAVSNSALMLATKEKIYGFVQALVLGQCATGAPLKTQ